MQNSDINAYLDAHMAKIFDRRAAAQSASDEPEMVIQNVTRSGRQSCPGKCHGNGTYYRPGAWNPESGQYDPGEDVNCDTCQARGWIEK